MKNLANALIKAQAEMEPLHKDAQNLHLKSRYATLAQVQDACLPALGRHGVVVFQGVGTEWQESVSLVRVSCTLYHAESGESIVNEVALVPVQSTPQGIGSAITYARRYLLMTMAGIAPEDDDGDASSQPKQRSEKPAQPIHQKPPQPTPPAHRAPSTPPTINGAHQTPVDDILLDKAAHDAVLAFVGELRSAEYPGAKRASLKQHQYAVGIIDAITGKETHRQVFKAIFNRDVTTDEPLSEGAFKLLLKYLSEKKSVKGDDGRWVNVENTDYDGTKVEFVGIIHRWAIEAAGQMVIDEKTGDMVEADGDRLFA